MGNRDDTTARILEAGLAILSEEGFAGLGVNSLARRSGADKQLIYRYFGGMDGFLAALGTRVAEGLTGALDGSGARPASYGQMAEALLLALFDHLQADANYRQLRLMEVAAPSTATAGFRAVRGAALARWVAAKGQALPPPPGCDAPALNAMLIAAVEGAAILGAPGMEISEASRQRQRAALIRLIRGVYGVYGE